MFGVPDEITDMKRSLEMSERSRFIYWKVVFGHQNGFEWFGYFTGVPRGYRNPSGKYWAYMGLSGEEEAAARRWRMPPKPSPNWTRGGGAAPLFLSPSTPFPFSPSPERKGQSY